MALSETASSAIGSTLLAVAGGVGGLFETDAPVRRATLMFEADARLPGNTDVFQPARPFDALVRVGPPTDGEAIRTVCIKLPDVYGPGCDQDFLLASSADGVPFHHATVPARRTDDRLFSSLWLYLAGATPVLFGAQATDFGFRFLLSGVLGRFQPIGTVTVDDAEVDAKVRFDARNSGGGIRALPPAMFYRG